MKISLNAIARESAPKSMWLDRSINNQVVVVLIDTGSTHSFLDPNVARRAKLPVHETSRLTFKVANGDSFNCQGYCSAVQVTLQGHTFTTTIFLLTLGGVNWY